MYPVGHMHVKVLPVPVTWQTAWFKHGLFEHAFPSKQKKINYI